MKHTPHDPNVGGRVATCERCGEQFFDGHSVDITGCKGAPHTAPDAPIKTPVRTHYTNFDKLLDADGRIIVTAWLGDTTPRERRKRVDYIALCINSFARLTAEVETLRAANEKLKGMIDNGLGWKDMVNDVTRDIGI